MQIENHTKNQERRILTAMVVNPIVCSRLCAKWEPGLFSSRWANIVAEWVVDFWRRYSKPPVREIQGLFESWAADNASNDEKTVQLVEKFLSALSKEYAANADSINADYVTDLAGKYFNEVRLRRLSKQVVGDLDRGNLVDALKRVGTFGELEVGSESVCDVLNDKQALKEALTESSECLIRYPEALGHFFNDALVRDGFVALQAPEKRGKTWWLIDLGWRAMLQRKKVAFFPVGDMSRNQMLRRFAIRAARRPIVAKKVKIPKSISREPDDKMPDISWAVKTYTAPMQWQEAWECLAAVSKRKDAKGGSFLRMSAHPNSSISVRGIDAILAKWEREDGWTPDVVIIDYADILAMPDGGEEHRNQINATWKQLRALSQRRHCLVLTATQSDAASYTSQIQDMTNFSEDKRKYAHVTGMFALNQEQEEKENGLYRLNWIVLRESEYDVSKVVYVAGCLGVAAPAIHSCF
jgi:hypothetical protein